MTLEPVPPRVYQRRRQRLGDALRTHPVAEGAGGAVCAVLFSTPTAIRNHDVEHRYRADADLLWLTGFREPECVLVLRVEGADVRTELFLRPRDAKKEIWTGRRLGPERATEALTVDAAFPIDQLATELPRLFYGAGSVFTHLGRRSKDDQAVIEGMLTARGRTRRTGRAPAAFVDVTPILGRLRVTKDAHELARMDAAGRAAMAGHRRAMAVCRPGITEARLEAELTYAFQRLGGDGHAYGPIVAAGANACILHYDENHAPIAEGDLVLIDAGAEVEGYAADITRTFPASGRFSGPQKALYEIVLAANLAGIAAAKPGVTLRAIDDVARLALAEGLVGVGLLAGDPQELAARKRGATDPPWHPGSSGIERFYMHGTGHYLGLDVHDAGVYHEDGVPVPLATGAAFTVEPGLYVAPDDEEAPEVFRGIGIRIEDDVVLTEDGCRVITGDLAKTVADIEAAVGQDPS